MRSSGNSPLRDGILIIAEVIWAPSAEVFVSKQEQLIDALGLRVFEMLDPFPEDVFVSIQLDQHFPREATVPRTIEEDSFVSALNGYACRLLPAVP